MTKLEFVNTFFFQWFFVRLTRCRKEIIFEVQVKEVSLLPDGSHGIGFNKKKSRYLQWYSFQGWIVPLTGWKKEGKILGKHWFRRITKKRSV